MMKFLQIILVFLGISNAHSQITYSSSDGPKAGLRIKNALLNFEDIRNIDKLLDTGLVNIDVSNAEILDGSEYEQRYKAAAEFPSGGLFPKANLASVSYPEENSADFIEKSATGLVFLGNLDNDGNYVRFKDGLILNPYPLKYGDAFPQRDSAYIFDGTFVVPVDINTNSQVEAWGEIKTPTGSYPYIRVKNKQIFEGFFFGSQILSATIENHYWFTSGKAEPISKLEMSETVLFDTTITYDSTFTYLVEQSSFVSLEDKKQNENDVLQVNYLNNEDAIQININKRDFNKAEITIIDASNKILYSQDVFGKDASHVVSTKNWPAGAYLVQLILDKNYMEFKKTVKF